MRFVPNIGSDKSCTLTARLLDKYLRDSILKETTLNFRVVLCPPGTRLHVPGRQNMAVVPGGHQEDVAREAGHQTCTTSCRTAQHRVHGAHVQWFVPVGGFHQQCSMAWKEVTRAHLEDQGAKERVLQAPVQGWNVHVGHQT